MSFSSDYVGGVLMVSDNKIRINSNNGGGYTELTASDPIQSATWSGDNISVVLVNGKALIYESTGMYRNA